MTSEIGRGRRETSKIERGRREVSERGQNRKRGGLYMYIYQNNCMCITGIHMCLYISQARLGEGGEKRAGEAENEER